MRVRGLVAVLLAAGALLTSVSEAAAPASSSATREELSAVLAGAARHARRLEQMERRGSFLLQGRMEELDSRGQVDGTKELVVRVTAKPSERVTEIIRYLEDGADKTAEAREKQKREEARQKPKKKFVLPFSPVAQERHHFELVERRPGRVRVSFTPREALENTYRGSAWIDSASGELLTMGFSPAKNPTFVDRLEVQVRFENRTSLGRAPSELSFEARGSLLVFKKHYRGSATLTEATIAF